MLALQNSSFLFPKSPPKPKKTQTQIKSSYNFLDLKPESKPETLSIDIQYHEPRLKPSCYDAVVIGCGPSGLRLAEQASGRGLKVCCIDPDPLMGWPNNYGSWVDEFEALGLGDCLDHTWPLTSVVIDDARRKDLDRPYGRVGRGRLKRRLMEGCVENGVRFHKAKAWTLEHGEFRSKISCSDGSDISTNLIVDASGFSSPFITYNKQRNCGYQVAHGILAEVDSHPFALDTMLLMDWRDSYLDNEPYLRPSNTKCPTFLYAMPFSSNLIFLEETSLVARPILAYDEVKKRMVARLRHAGIRVRRVIEDEKCLIVMGGPLPTIPQNVMAIGGNSGLVHPASGYMVARALKYAPVVADAMAECLGSTRMIRGKAMYTKLWNSLWTKEMKREREFYRFGMETLLKLDLEETRRFFEAFFQLDPYYWEGYLAARLSLKEIAELSMSLFGHASALSKLDIATKCPLPLAQMVGNLAAQIV